MYTPKEESIQGLVHVYQEAMQQYKQKTDMVEFEIRMDQNKISKVEFNHIFKALYQHGFTIHRTEYLLKIQPNISGISSDYRVVMDNLAVIQEYCQSDVLPDIPKCTHLMKKSLLQDKQNKILRSIKNPDFGFRSSIQQEIELTDKNDTVRNALKQWPTCLKSFRYLKRTSLTSPDFPNLRIDMSEVRMNKKRNERKSFKESNVLSSPVSYEVEIEVVPNSGTLFPSEDTFRVGDEVFYLNDQLGNRVWKINGINNNDFMISTEESKEWTYTEPQRIRHIQQRSKDSKTLAGKLRLVSHLKTVIKYIISGIQGTPFPVPFPVIQKTLNDYLRILKKMNKDQSREEYTKSPYYFIGPSSYALQKSNVLPRDEDSSTVSIRDGFCVTDKADGDRKLLYIDTNNKLFFIDTNLNVQYTGCDLDKALNMRHTIIDGEHLTSDKYGNRINTFAAFDIYCHNSIDIRRRPFKKDRSKDKPYEEPSSSRYTFLQQLVGNLANESYVKYQSTKHKLHIMAKDFIFSSNSDKNSIFKCCETILTRIKGNSYPYATDGIIFTSKGLGVNQESKTDKRIITGKYTWGHSFKWKPPQFNTIDFLFRLKRNASGESTIHTKMIQGNTVEYFVGHLFVGYDPKKHGHMNSQERILYMDFGGKRRKHNSRGYKPIEFRPTNPYDRTAHICHILVSRDTNGKPVMFTEEKDLMEDDMIIEFRYEKQEKDKYNNWIPLRVRYDKTSDYKTSHSNFGNAYHVANSNWQTIHNPIDENMLIYGANLKSDSLDPSIDEQYYNRSKKKSNTIPLRNFHNLYVKSAIISAVASKQGETCLLDMAVGKGGDINKWIQSKLKAVLGIDIAYDNIHNNSDGACARYLDLQEKQSRLPICMFIHGDTSKLMNNGDFEFQDIPSNEDDEKSLPGSYTILQALMGSSHTPKSQLSVPFLLQHYGLFRNKFDVCSIQFALHYMFENKEKLHNFLTNVSQYTNTGKYFIGTCYDGKKIYDLLQDKKEDEMVELYERDTKIWHIKKKYNDDLATFLNDDESSVGKKISVYQESINQEFDEYLVNFDYFIKIMDDYGFVLANDMPISPLGSFETLFNTMIKESHSKEAYYGQAKHMTENEKKISFLNQYFIFQKQRDIMKPIFDGETIDYTIGKATPTHQTIILS